MKAILILQDGFIFRGESFGVQGEQAGKVVLNTAVVGYQEMLTDPANAGRILTLTYPLIGNYGVAPKFNESKKAWVSGLVIKEKSRMSSNWQAKGGIDDFMVEQNIVGITGIDTRTLAVHIREKGELLGVISTRTFEPKELLSKMEAFGAKTSSSVLPQISVSKITHLDGAKKKSTARVAILDLGITNGIIEQLQALGFSLTLFPYNTAPQEILTHKFDGLIISNGPEEDPGLDIVAQNIKGLIGKIPIMGISTGHQVLAKSQGARVTKMKLGHRGVNYPIYNPPSYKGEITVQNHSCVVDADSLLKIKNIKITAYNLNDRTVEEMESKRLKILGVQYYPSSPGFDEINSAFQKFSKMLN